MSSSTRSWRQICSDADAEFYGLDARMPVVYEFCCRKFRQPVDPYQGGLIGALLAEDGTPLLAEDGSTLMVESAGTPFTLDESLLDGGDVLV